MNEIQSEHKCSSVVSEDLSYSKDIAKLGAEANQNINGLNNDDVGDSDFDSQSDSDFCEDLDFSKLNDSYNITVNRDSD